MEEKIVLARGFELFETKSLPLQTASDEPDYYDMVPTMYKMFTKTFVTTVSINKRVRHLLSKNNPPKSLNGGYLPQSDEIGRNNLIESGHLPFGGFFRLDFSFESYLSEEYEDWYESGLVLIGPEPWGEGGYLLVVDEDKAKNIYPGSSDFNLKNDNIIVELVTGEYYKLAENVFDFVRCLEVVEAS